MSEFYKNSIEHIWDELKRIDVLINLAVQTIRVANNSQTEQEFQGLYISEDKIESILKDNTPFKRNQPIVLSNIIQDMKKRIEERKAESLKKGINLTLHRLSQIFALTHFEVDVILICLAPELDLKYETLYAYLQDDVTKKRPMVDLILNLLCNSFAEKFTYRKYFDNESNLLRNCILSFSNEQKGEAPLLAKSLKLNDRIIKFLLEASELDASLLPFSSLIEPKASFKQIILEDDLKAQLKSLCEKKEELQKFIVFFQGPYGAGRKFTAEAMCKQIGKKLLIINLERLLNSNLSLEEFFKIIFREAVLQNALLYFDKFSILLGEGEKAIALRDILLYEINRFYDLVFLGSEASWEPIGLLQDKKFIRFEFLVPSFSLRKRLWADSLDGRYKANIDIDQLSNKFKFTGGKIRDAITTAENIAVMRDNRNTQISMEDLYQGCKLQSNKVLSTLSRKIKPKYKWEDIVLPEDKITQLKEICSYVKYRNVVYLDWGFDKKISLGKGLNVLFSGSSGTGKTMSAEIIANELNLDLYKIDLSCVVSKYIGETEKNLAKIFKEAETSNAILFFDEADALFGKRSEVKDSHDRYANIEIAYLLQKMEEYEGIVILATNLQKNIDEAFTRRMHFIVEIPFPDDEYRYRIWQAIFPKEVPMGDDIDFKFLAKNFKIAGGNIKNIILTSAFFAAEDSKVINMEHIIRATKREFQKIGRVCVQSDFGKYYEMIK